MDSLPEEHDCQIKPAIMLKTKIGKTIQKPTTSSSNLYKDKERLQTPAVTPKQIQPPIWKKTRVELLTNSLYYYTSGSVINIPLTDVSTLNVTSTFGQLSFQSKQKKAELLRTYSDYFEEFKLRLPTPSGFQSPPLQPNFGNMSPWKITKSEKEEEKEAEDQEFTYQNPIPENLNIKTPNFQTQQDPNLENLEIRTLNFQTPQNPNNTNPKQLISKTYLQ
ncbi:hypothetical protein G9A89_018154 [Geosiphon pyriformis]|nr:hypothetical protein G9A89_018154 [Geosiphon pyriformis]